MALLVLPLVHIGAPPAAAQPSEAAAVEPADDGDGLGEMGSGIQLTAEVQRSLGRLEELWLQWSGALLQDEPAKAGAMLDEILVTASNLGLDRLPELSFGVLVKAVEAAEQGQRSRARWALAMAERLDPERPEISFTAARIHSLDGAYHLAALEYFKGMIRLFRTPSLRRLWMVDFGLWCLYLALFTGVLFLVVQTAAKGGGLYHDTVLLLRGFAPAPVAYPLAVALLLWPLLLPLGPLWLLVYWSVLLWGYGAPSERSVLICLWLLIGLAPLFIDLAGRRVEGPGARAMRVLDGLEERRLYGDLFTDLSMLRTILPESREVLHLVADLHRLVGQWDLARAHYGDLLIEAPEDATILMSMGAYYFHKGDYGTAIEHFERATEAEPTNVAAFYNLSQAHSEAYFFERAQASLQQAKEIDSNRVSSWISEGLRERVVVPEGGLERIGTIRRQVEQAESLPTPGALVRAHLGSLLAALGLVAVAALLHLARRGKGYSEPMVDLDRGLLVRLSRAVVPGLQAAELGQGWRAFFSLALPVGLLLLPLGESLLFELPLGLAPPATTPWLLTIVGLSVMLAVRLWSARRG